MTGQPQNGPAGADLLEHARRLVADWPPLTPQQRTRLAVLLQLPSSLETSPVRRAA